MTQTQSSWLIGVGEMADRIRGHDWAATPLGPIERWPLPLRILLSTILDHPMPMVLGWGPDLITLHNDAYRPLLGRKPDALGRPFLEVWDEARDIIAPQIDRALVGETTRLDDAPFMLLRQEHPEEAFFNYTFSPVRDEIGAVVGVLNTGFETTTHVLTERRRAAIQDALREGEERQAFLLKLSDALRAERDPIAVGQVAVDMLARHMGVDRCYVARSSPEGLGWVGPEHHAPDLAPMTGEYRINTDFPEAMRRLETKPLIIHNLWSDPALSERDKSSIAALGVEALFVGALRRGEEFFWGLAVGAKHPRAWTQADRMLIEDTADRTWAAVERARAEATIRDSEERFQQFAASSSDALWIRDAATLAMEYASPAIQTIYGVPPEDILGDPKRWAAIIVPEDRDCALMNLERARAGEAVTHEFRILRATDGAFRWIRNTDFPLRDEQGHVQRIGGIAQDVTEAKQAAEHQTVLLLELQHRVRNILAMVRSVANQTGDTASDVEDYRDLLEGRLRALARVQTLLTQAANAGVDLATLIRAEVEAQAAHESQCRLSGPELVLSPKAAEVLTLAIHELATNALKYGAFSHTAGYLAVSWRVIYPVEEPWLHLDWIETGAPAPLPPPRREGFGTTLIQGRIPYELKGRGHLAITADGARCQLEFPLRRGDSILETDTVTLSTTIAGGSLDMTGEADLNGCKVLVVEDDFFLANDTKQALRKAGGRVLGPAGHEDDALALLASEAPSCALVDINLGHGAEFRVSEALQDAGVPFVFVTGYDDVVIPARFNSVERLRKPVDYRQIVRAAARLCAA